MNCEAPLNQQRVRSPRLAPILTLAFPCPRGPFPDRKWAVPAGCIVPPSGLAHLPTHRFGRPTVSGARARSADGLTTGLRLHAEWLAHGSGFVGDPSLSGLGVDTVFCRTGGGSQRVFVSPLHFWLAWAGAPMSSGHSGGEAGSFSRTRVSHASATICLVTGPLADDDKVTAQSRNSSHSCFVSLHAAFRHRPSVLQLRSMNPSLRGWYSVVLVLCIPNSRHTSSTTFDPKFVP